MTEPKPTTPEMSEERADYVVPLIILPGSVEARLIEKYRATVAEWRQKRKWLFIAITPEGNAFVLRGEPGGTLTADIS